MSRGRRQPRPEQVAELTRGQTLPLAAIPEPVMRVVAETVVRAWNDLAANHGDILKHGTEPEVSALLESRLNTLRDEDPCWESVANGASRGRESINFDGGRLENRPDFSVHLTRRQFGFPLAVECKLIDHTRRKTVDLYCRKGLARFVTGEYAWATREAFMLAYVRDGGNIATNLLPHLIKKQTETPDPCATSSLPVSVSGFANDLARSRHWRNFRYLGNGEEPGAIELWHLWLPAR